MVCCGPGLKGGEFGEPVRDPVPRINVGAKFVVAAVEVLNEGVPCADRFRRAQPLRPRIGRSRDFRRSLPDLALHRRDSPSNSLTAFAPRASISAVPTPRP
jgi:hypothetical protein